MATPNEQDVFVAEDKDIADPVKVRRKICDLNICRIYLSHTLTSWGDRMWGFAVGLYLVILFPDSLKYTAIYGFTTCVCVIFGGPCIGNWVDKSMRLKAATYAIATQNVAASCCAALLIIMMNYPDTASPLWGISSHILLLCAIIVFAVIGELASVGSKIVIEKDWIVVLAENDESRLSKMNAVMRTIDLTTSILAPAVVAQIIYYVSNIAGAAFIAGWNLISGAIEIYLLHKIFLSFPELAQAKQSLALDDKIAKTNSQEKNVQKGPTIFVESGSDSHYDDDESKKEKDNFSSPVVRKNSHLLLSPDRVLGKGQGENEFIPTPRGLIGLPAADFAEIALTPLPNHQYQDNIQLQSASKNSDGGYEFDRTLRHEDEIDSPTGFGIGQSDLTKSSEREKLVQSPDLGLNSRSGSICFKCYKRTLECLVGWKDYFEHPLRFAGLGLALLYMTVLGFDSITIGYMYSQGVSASVIGILTSVGAVSGILGSLSFPFLRRKLGKCAVGNFGFGFETLCLILCVLSVFVPGSPFEPDSVFSRSASTSEINSIGNSRSHSERQNNPQQQTFSSVILFSIGILVSRYGLWIADLSVTQFFQEEVPESQRGILNGVQDSLNQALNLLKFILVILFPEPSTFGFLIFLSWMFVFSGWASFMVFTCSWHRRRSKINCVKGCSVVQL